MSFGAQMFYKAASFGCTKRKFVSLPLSRPRRFNVPRTITLDRTAERGDITESLHAFIYKTLLIDLERIINNANSFRINFRSSFLLTY